MASARPRQGWYFGSIAPTSALATHSSIEESAQHRHCLAYCFLAARNLEKYKALSFDEHELYRWRCRQGYDEQAVAFEQAIIKRMEATGDGAQAARLRLPGSAGHQDEPEFALNADYANICFEVVHPDTPSTQRQSKHTALPTINTYNFLISR